MKIIGVDVLDRFELFASYLLQDMVYFIIAMLLIFVIAGLYTKSVMLVIFTLFNVIFSFGLAYFMYYIVFQIPHMPFMALLTILLLIAIGADDVFIFADTFEQMKAAQPNGSLEAWISGTMHHAALSILVTSLTTAAALYANAISEITDIRGFGILSGTALVANYLLMITWIPAGLVLREKLSCTSCKTKEPACIRVIHGAMTRITTTIFHRFLPACVKKAWFLWLFLFLGLGISGVVVTFFTPKLDLPSSKDFALFDKDSTIEVWFQNVKYAFRYYQQETARTVDSGLPLVAMWGIKGDDNGNYLDPDSRSTLEMDSDFDMSHPDAQKWLLDFCYAIKNASFVDKNSVRKKPCTLELFNDFVLTSCSSVESNINLSLRHYNMEDCCGQTSIPIAQSKFQRCYTKFIAMYITHLGRYTLLSILGRALWNETSGDLVAFEYGFVGNQGFSANYSKMDPFYRETQDFMNDKLKTAPNGLRRGWMTPESNLGLYDLQRALAFGTYAAIGMSMVASFIVMFITSLNIVITFFAILTIFFTISVCAGILVLLGWELNIVESVTLTMSVGLSIDFCIHYGMGYRLSTLAKRKLRMQESFERVGAAIFMAASTTFIAGACIMPSIILFYVQLGTFLMTVMAMSWLFATFFFQSLCYVLGPQNSFAQIPSPFRFFCPKGDNRTNQPQVAVVPETQNSTGVSNPAFE